jgi:hypothetical protein
VPKQDAAFDYVVVWIKPIFRGESSLRIKHKTKGLDVGVDMYRHALPISQATVGNTIPDQARYKLGLIGKGRYRLLHVWRYGRDGARDDR